MAAPTLMASWPMPLNHLLILPCLSRLSIFSSMMRGIHQLLVGAQKKGVGMHAALITELAVFGGQ
jgi:hypothetical protein